MFIKSNWIPACRLGMIGVLFVVALFTGCVKPESPPQPSANPPDTAAPANAGETGVASTWKVEKSVFVGHWEFDFGLSVNQTVNANKDQVDSPIELRQAVQTAFRDMQLSIDIRDDGSFSCQQKTAFDDGEFRGTWTIEAAR